MQILKFGGSSVASAPNIERVCAIIEQAIQADKTMVVASALGGCTDKLVEIGHMAADRNPAYTSLLDELILRHEELVQQLGLPEQSELHGLMKELREVCRGVFLLQELSLRTLDLIMSFGELLSTTILSRFLHHKGITNCWIDARRTIRTNHRYGNAQVDMEATTRHIEHQINTCPSRLYIVPGFISSNDQGITTTLGRGGSDYTASLLAVCAKARMLEIWTDVSGMMTADPRVVPQARPIPHISYKEALELSHFGARVVYPPTIQPVVSHRIPIKIKNTFAPEEPGTLIEQNPPESDSRLRGLSASGHIALLSMEGSGMVGIPGYSARLFGALAAEEINIILITQASSVHTMCVAIDEKNAESAKKAVDDTFAYEISLQKVEPLRVETGFSIISLVGDDLQQQSGTGGRMFEALGRKNINIRAIAQGSSEKNISTVVGTADEAEALRAIHEAFF
ncbi:MAG: aspartate kinase [Bacteroidales bacterium]|nr:aspartate kinase [Bacteroidales bacterium]MCL2739113.1 aspartate kinase [Bacteroidales bacterium]